VSIGPATLKAQVLGSSDFTDLILKDGEVRFSPVVTALAIAMLAAGPWLANGAQKAVSGAASRSVWDGVYTKEQAERGKELYTTHCLACHGESLEGNGPAKTLVGPEFTANWNGISVGDMLDRTRTSMPLARPGTLSRQQVADLLAFVLSANKFPAGEYELPRQAEVLAQITFLATRPDRDAHQIMR
jgi:quinoprotein glucose dehydrogenase